MLLSHGRQFGDTQLEVQGLVQGMHGGPAAREQVALVSWAGLGHPPPCMGIGKAEMSHLFLMDPVFQPGLFPQQILWLCLPQSCSRENPPGCPPRLLPGVQGEGGQGAWAASSSPPGRVRGGQQVKSPSCVLPALFPPHQPMPPGDFGHNRRGGQLQKQGHHATLAPSSHFVGASTPSPTGRPSNYKQLLLVLACRLWSCKGRGGSWPWLGKGQQEGLPGHKAARGRIRRAQGDPREGAPSLAKSHFQGGCVKSERPLHGEGRAWAPGVCSDSCSLAQPAPLSRYGPPPAARRPEAALRALPASQAGLLLPRVSAFLPAPPDRPSRACQGPVVSALEPRRFWHSAHAQRAQRAAWLPPA